MKKIKVLFFIVCLPFLAHAQQWHQYSDSVLVNFKKNNIEKAKYFIGLADADLQQTLVLKDTIYADYLYRKGVVKSSLGDYDSTLLKQALDIWESGPKKNYLKIMKINYFLGNNFFMLGFQSQKINLELRTSFYYYEKCYDLIKENNLQNNPIYKLVLTNLFRINSDNNEKELKSKKYAKEYIEYIKSTFIEDFDFNYVQAFKCLEDYANQEKILLQFLAKYESQKLSNPELSFKIYFELFVNKQNFRNGIYPIFPIEIIKYGEKAIDVFQSNNLKTNNVKPGIELSTIYLGLEIAYGQIKDNVNAEKCRKLNYEYYSKNKEIDYWDEIEKLYNENDYVNFKIKFDEYEIKFKKENQFTDLLEIYKYSLTLFERSILFSKEDINKQIEFISNNINSLTSEDKLLFDVLLIEFNIVTIQFEKALEICNNNLDMKSPERKLKIYNYKATCEYSLGYKEKAIKTLTKNLELAISTYGDNDPRLLPFMQALLDVDLMGTNPNSIKIETKVLKIIYENKLEQTLTAVGIWDLLGKAAMNRNNYKDALIYFEKSIKIIENTKTINNPNLYLGSLYGLINIYILQNNFVKAKEYLEKNKKYLDENPNIMTLMYEGYYYSLGNYYFQQDKFMEAKANYEKSFTFYDSKKNSLKKIHYYFCSYLLENNADEFIENIKTYQKENNNTYWGWGIIYLLKYNSGDYIGARNLLEMQLNKLISNSNKNFNLLSDNEKENLYKSFVNQFEYLNSYLSENNSTFIEKYINFRFYSKSLLFSNHFKSDENNIELYAEFKNNTSMINKAIESKSEDLKSIENLKNKNREIEKFLSENIKPLIVPTLKDLKNKLTDNEAYVEIIRVNKQSHNSTKKAKDIIKFFTDSISYGAIVIKKNSTPKFFLIDGSNQLENQYASSFKTKIQNKQDDFESYNLLFLKIDNELKDIKKIYLVTDGIYNSINIESIYNPNRKQYLIDYLKIQLIQNVRAITKEKKEFKIGVNTKASLFGNPDFDLLIANKKENEFSLERGLENELLDEIKSCVKISPLNGTQKEIETLNAILNNSNSTVELFSNANATEDNLKKIQFPNILHIATHGYFLTNNDASKTKQSIANLIDDNYKNDSYLKSGLLLAGAQNTLNGKQPESENNGIITAEEAKSLNLKDTELVVLSACETGLGDNLVGEGVIGLQRAFMIAGAKSVIMSLWSVSDQKTQELMTLFYTNWIKNNMSKEDALYQAKVEMKKLYPEPYYWAGFVLLE